MLPRAISASLSTRHLPFIYHSIRCLICYVVLISLLRQYCSPAAATLLSFCGNIVVLLRQHCCSAAATLLFCCGNIVVLLRQYEKGMKQYKGDVLFTGQQ